MKKVTISLWLILGIILDALGPLAIVTVANAETGESVAKSKQMLHLGKDAQRLLRENEFVVVPSKAYRDMNQAYEAFRKDNIPIFVTTDSILHTTHLLFDYLLRIIEVDHFMNDLKQLTRSMITASLNDDKTTENAAVKKSIHANIGFFSVAAGLLNEKQTIPPDVVDMVEAELKLIRNHKGFNKTPVFDYLEDYSQYAPRGHYTRSEEFKSYFKAMMWYGRMGFYLNPSTSLKITEDLTKQLTRQALLIVRALGESNIETESAPAVWKRIYKPTTFFVGKTDDLDFYDYKALALKIYKKIPSVKDLADESKLDQFMSAAQNLRKPKILSTFVIDTEGKKNGAKEVALSFRFMGQRFVPDSYMFQHLVYPEVLFYTGNSRPFTLVISRRGPIRGFPRGLDIMAVLGSEYAEEIIRVEGDSDYEKYDRQLKKLKKEFDLKKEEWSSNLYWSWLYCLKPLIAASGDSVPPFMRYKAWAGKALHTALSSWAELRHDTILYAKQSYTMMVGGLPPPPQLTHGYVEPYPEVFFRVREMIERMRKGLVLRKLLDKRLENKLKRYETLLGTLETIATKELMEEPITENEYKAIWNIGSTLESVTRFPHEIISGIRSATDDKMVVIADVHTDPNSGQVLEEAVGFPFIINVSVSIKGKDQIVRGPVFSYYEFKQPMSDRLTDEQWQKILKEGREPPLPKWSDEFVSKQISEVSGRFGKK